MSDLPRITGRICAKALEKAGFYFKRKHGSHIILRRDIPLRYEIKPLSLRQTMKKKYFDNKEIKKFCEKHYIKKLGLFGSVLRDDFNENSDIDVLIEFEQGHAPGFFGLFEMEDELTILMGGRKVDLRTAQDLSQYFRDEVLSTMDVEYEAR